MKRAFASAFVLLLALSACSRGPVESGNAANAPGNAPAMPAPKAAFERAYVVSCAPTMDARGFMWFESGSEVPFPADALSRHIEAFAKAGGHWDAKNNRSENRVALRIDCRAPVSEVWRFVDALVAQRVYKFALAMLQEFDPPFHVAGGGEPKWELDERYTLLQLPVEEGLEGAKYEKGEFALGLNLQWKSSFSRCTLQTVFEKDARPVSEIEELFAELLPAAAESRKFKRADQGVYSFGAKLGEEALEKAVKRIKGELRAIEIGETGKAASEKRLEPGEHAPVAYLFLALDSVARLNAARAREGRKPAEIRFCFGTARGRYFQNVAPPPPPEPEFKPESVKPWGDPPGEMFEPSAAFTVVIEKVKGEQFVYYWGQSPKPRGLREFREEIANFAKQRDVKGGHPGWDTEKKISGNVLAIRCDIEAPYAKFMAVMESAFEAGIYRFAIAARSAFDESDYSVDGRNNRPLLNNISGDYFRFDMDYEHNSSMPKEHCEIYISYDNKEKFALTTIAIGARGKRTVEGSRCTLAEISPELAGDDAGRILALENRVRMKTAIVANIESYIKDSGVRFEKLVIHSGATASSPRFDTPCGFLLVHIEVANEINARRRIAEKPAVKIDIWDSVPVPPEPEMKPEEQVPFPKEEPPSDD